MRAEGDYTGYRSLRNIHNSLIFTPPTHNIAERETLPVKIFTASDDAHSIRPGLCVYTSIHSFIN